MKRLFIFLFAVIGFVAVKGQIGYQVTLLNTATGEPRANETVSVYLDITDSAGGVIYSGTQTATSNDFGVLSLTVGNATTFDNVDWSKLPFFVSATVDGTLIGRSQILSVPVAEYAKHTGQLTPEILCSKTWTSIYAGGAYTETYSLHFETNGFAVLSCKETPKGDYSESKFRYYITNGNDVFLVNENSSRFEDDKLSYISSINSLFSTRFNSVFE